METSKILAKLKSFQHGQESPQSQEARDNAISILSCPSDVRQLLLDMLTKVVKPLFSKQQHPNLTVTGRKKLVPDAPTASRSSDTIDWDDKLKTWKNGWTTDLLLFCLSQYPNLPTTQEKSTLESQFHLLVPPILNLVDDGDLGYKTQGCKLLRLLCERVTHCQSDILKRTGLSDVFSDALKANFLHLPTLTPEKDSLKILSELYPAFRALVDARFPITKPSEPDLQLPLSIRSVSETSQPIKAAPVSAVPTPSPSKPLALPNTKDKDARQSMLDLVLRHGILASYAHATDHVCITTLLLHEASLVVSSMGIYAAKYLQTLLPLLRGVLSDPFATASTALLLSALECLDALVRVCWPRIRDKWWGECLRGLVACWVQLEDDERVQKRKTQDLEVKMKLRQTSELLANIVGEDFIATKQQLEQEHASLKELFSTSDAS